jgi:hypothetical protein
MLKIVKFLCALAVLSTYANAEPTWFWARKTMIVELAKNYGVTFDLNKRKPSTHLSVEGSYGGASGGFAIEIPSNSLDTLGKEGDGFCTLWTEKGDIVHAGPVVGGNTECAKRGDVLLRGQGVKPMYIIKMWVADNNKRERMTWAIPSWEQQGQIINGKIPRCSHGTEYNNDPGDLIRQNTNVCFLYTPKIYKQPKRDAVNLEAATWMAWGGGVRNADSTNVTLDIVHDWSEIPLKEVSKSLLH